ncbi:MAG: hypothetical protein LHW45_07095 [Candidatus Cloacimonetes bacterium]|nr:hypothetical protein [Candidatus Cloacimonadota bacterium]MDY0367377.1 hypothetical protein [Candidatus Syntrophosphaera sp.]
MKKLVILMLVLLAFSGLAAVQLKYWTSEVYLQTIPREMTDGSVLTRAATVFTPPVNCDLEGVYFPFYGPGALGQANVLIEIWPVDVNGLPDQSGMFPLASATILYADLINWATAPVGEDFNYVDLSAANLVFGPTGANGTAFAMVMTSPNGLLPNTKTATMHDASVAGSSYNYYTVVEPVGWDMWYDYCFTAEVTYLGDQVDVEASSLWFTGDFFMAPGEVINYEADVTNNSMDNTGTPIAVTGVDVALALWDAADMTTPLWVSSTTVNLAASQELHLDTFADCTLPTTPGRYILQLQAWHDLDVTPGNNNVYLQQDVPDLTLGDALAYDEDNSSMAHAYYDAGDGWANAFWYYDQPVKITEVSFEMRDNTWPIGALGNLSYAIFPDDGTGLPDMANPLVPITPATCTLGEWNTYDVSAYDINIPAGETFYVAYFQVGDYEAGAPGLMGDMSIPISSWATSWAYYYDADLLDYTWVTPNATDEDMCIRCSVELGTIGVEAPIISIVLDSGYPTISWDAVTGALSYNVYGSNDPTALQPWTPLATAIGDLGYMYEGAAPYQFFYVTASTETDGSKMALNPNKVKANPAPAPLEKSVPRATYKKRMITDQVN